MDKSWIKADRDSLQYEIGVENFLIFAEENAKNQKKYCALVQAALTSKNLLSR